MALYTTEQVASFKARIQSLITQDAASTAAGAAELDANIGYLAVNGELFANVLALLGNPAAGSPLYAIVAGAYTRRGISTAAVVVVAPTHQQQIDFVKALYSTYYHRASDTPGLNYWVGLLENNSKTHAQVENAFATSPDMSPNAGQTLQAYLSAQGISPNTGWTFSANGNSIVSAGGINNDDGTGVVPAGGGILDTIGETAEGLPLVGAWITSLASSTGVSSGVIALVGLGLAAYAFGVFDTGSGGRRR